MTRRGLDQCIIFLVLVYYCYCGLIVIIVNLLVSVILVTLG